MRYRLSLIGLTVSLVAGSMAATGWWGNAVPASASMFTRVPQHHCPGENTVCGPTPGELGLSANQLTTQLENLAPGLPADAIGTLVADNLLTLLRDGLPTNVADLVPRVVTSSGTGNLLSVPLSGISGGGGDAGGDDVNAEKLDAPFGSGLQSEVLTRLLLTRDVVPPTSVGMRAGSGTTNDFAPPPAISVPLTHDGGALPPDVVPLAPSNSVKLDLGLLQNQSKLDALFHEMIMTTIGNFKIGNL